MVSNGKLAIAVNELSFDIVAALILYLLFSPIVQHHLLLGVCLVKNKKTTSRRVLGEVEYSTCASRTRGFGPNTYFTEQ